MLEKEDLIVLKNLMETVLDKRLAETEERILKRVDERLAEMEERILRQVDERLDERLAEMEERILKQVDERLNKRLTEMEERILKQVDERLDLRQAETEERILKQVDERIVKSESLMFNEMARIYEALDHKIEVLNSKVEEMNQYYRMFRLDQDNMTILLSLIDALTKRVEILESKTA